MQCACAILHRHVACPALKYFSTLSHKRHDFRNKVIGYEMCVLILSTNFVWNISHSKNSSARYCHKYTQAFTSSTRHSCKNLIKLEFFSTDFRKNTQMSYFMKIRPVGADGRTDMTKLIVGVRNCANSPKTVLFRNPCQKDANNSNNNNNNNNTP
jgi:hypothetical protein